MKHKFIGTKVVTAWHEERDGKSGMAVKYEDDYISWSPDEAFKPAYRVAEGPNQYLTFGDALHFLKLGCKLQRRGWNGKGLTIELQRPDANSKMTLPYLYMSYPADAANTPGARVPWLASQTDMLAEDWQIVEAN